MRSRLASFLALSAAGLFAQSQPAFEVASVRLSAGPIPGVPPMLGQQRTTPDTLTARHSQLIEIMRRAYGVLDEQLVGTPAWTREPREVSGLALVVGKNGPKLTRSQGGSDQISAAGGVFKGQNVPISRLAGILSSMLRRPVIDATGLEGTYDFSADPRPYAGQGPPDLQGMVITALQEELGLKLESRKFELQVMVVDHIEQPDEN